MGYLTDAPGEVKELVRIVQDFGQYRYDPSNIFTDFIDYGTTCLLTFGDKEKAADLQNRYGDDYPKFKQMFYAWIKIMDEQLDGQTLWFDALGMLYEYVAHSGKKSHLGQFFTPHHLCDLMTELNIDGTKKLTHKRINDPACGSGRTLLSFNAYQPGNYLFGEDLDPICAKMAAMNFAIHGCQWQITCMNTLSLQDWKFCYQVNRYHAWGMPAIPHLELISQAESIRWRNYIADRNETPSQGDKPVPLSPEPATIIQLPEPKISKHGQLTMF